MDEIDVDVLVVGSGGGGLTAAITAHDHGGTVLVVEKSDKYGGTTATSGGGIWIPCNHLMKAHGESDSPEEALKYMKACIGDIVPEERLKAYIEEGPKMLKFLEDKSQVKFISTPYSDYFPQREGGKEGWRTLDPIPVSAAKLGKEFENLREPHPQTVFSGVTITMNEAKLVLAKAPGWKMTMAKLLASYWFDIPFRLKTKRHRRLALGNGLVARCLLSLQNRNVPIWRNAPMKKLIVKDGIVKGAVVKRGGVDIQVNAARGVIMAVGGFEHNADMRAKYLPSPTKTSWSATPGDNTGDGIIAAQDAGAGLSLMDGAWWGPVACVPGRDRAQVLFAEPPLPGVIIVNNKGERFLNEAQSYDEVGRQLYQADIPAWIIFDANVRRKYMIGPLMPAGVMPDKKLGDDLKSIVKIADSLEDLAEQTGVDLDGLKATTTQMAEYAKTGKDLDFDKGGNAYDRYYGDPENKPNPCLGPVKDAPFYAFPLYPGDIGTKGGIDVDINARALDKKGRPIAGLYATGNTASSVMGHTYPGAGSTIGPAMTFGYVAARHAMGVNE